MSDLSLVIILLFIVLNIAALALYGNDKRKAVKDKWRTPEKTLLLMGLVAPWGSILGMKIFHHKTQKTKFKLNYVFAVLHVIIAVLLIYKPW